MPARFPALLLALPLLFAPASSAGAVELTGCAGPLEPSLTGTCGGVDEVGCCDSMGRVLWCQDGDLYCIDCAVTFPVCGWNPIGYYDCGQEAGAVDPDGEHPPACAGDCPPTCAGKESCSPECPGDCGTCSAGAFCQADGSCYVPECGVKECGLDPLGFSCGACPPGTQCVEGLFQCLPLPDACVPQDVPGCGGCGCETCVCDLHPFCCELTWDIFCVAACEQACGYDCSPCPAEPDCADVECGEFCGIDCGTCPGGETCFQGQCCISSCAGKECGSDGCGGSCGDCPGTDVCEAGACVPCAPMCDGKVCGADGCGGSCGECPEGTACSSGQCVTPDSCVGSCGGQADAGCWCDSLCQDYGDCCEDFCEACPDVCEAGDPCNGITWEGCCDGDVIRYCEDGEIKSADCAEDPSCGWNAAESYYDCGTDGAADPEGVFPLDCAEVCEGSCEEKVCGDDGCGGDCGACPEGEVCTPEGQCCTPDCVEKNCGGDGCGGDCGACPPEEICEDGACVPGNCGDITWEGCCSAGTIKFCDQGVLNQMSCAGDPECGWNAAAGYYDCGTKGGADPDGVLPLDCMAYCVPDCTDRVCGSDGCDGSCGECDEGDVCIDHACVPDPCAGVDFFGCCDGETLRWCQDGASFEKDCTKMTGLCGWSAKWGEYNCGTEGGEDPSAAHPKPCPGACAPACEGMECGDDGCEGTCGTCGDGETCQGGACVPDEPAADPAPDTTSPDAGGSDTGGVQHMVVDKGSGGCAAAPAPTGANGVLLIAAAMCLVLLRHRSRQQKSSPSMGEVPEGRRGRDEATSSTGRARLPTLLAVLLLLTTCGGGGRALSPDLVDPGDTVSRDTVVPADTPPPDTPADSYTDAPIDTPPPPDTIPDIPPEDIDSDLSPDPPFDCDAIPPGPFELVKIDGAIASEDLAFDGVGHLIGSNNQAIYKSTADGQVGLLAPDVEFRAGMRYLPNGLLAVNDNYKGRVLLVDPDGVVSVLLSGLSYPNGMTVDKQGYLYVTEHDAGRVLRIHSYTGEYTVLTEEIKNPNGITFNNAYDTLYIGSFGASAIYAMSISPDGVPGRVSTWADFSDTPGLLDGMGVDICGNVYVCEYGATDIWRVSPDGQQKEKIIIGGPYDTYLPNFQWGRGPGWDPLSLYIPDGWQIGVWRAQIGVPSKPLAFPPGE